MTALPDESTKGLRTHYRESRLQLWLPLALAFLLIVALTLLLIVPQDAGTADRASALASLALMVVCLLPGIALLLVVFTAIIASVVGMNWLHRLSIPPLQRVERVAYEARQRVDGWAQRANQSAVRWGSMLAPLDTFFDRLEGLLKEHKDGRE